jgi:hypothetical protein
MRVLLTHPQAQSQDLGADASRRHPIIPKASHRSERWRPRVTWGRHAADTEWCRADRRTLIPEHCDRQGAVAFLSE